MGGRETRVICAFVLWGLFRMAAGSGQIEVLFVYYTDTCMEHWNTNPCDPMFAFCLSTPQTGGLSVDNCNYASTGQSSGHFHNANNIDMEHLSDIKGHPNPWIVRVNRFLGPLVMLVIKATDVDIFSTEHMHTWATVLNETVWPRQAEAVWQERLMSDNSHTMRFRVRMYCDTNYYTSSCDVICVPDNSTYGHYLCEPGTGRRVCLPGWQGSQCTQDIDECALSYCHSGECTNLPGAYHCSCPDNYTGKNCSVLASRCSSNPCQNGGACFEQPSLHSFFCVCTETWGGETCNNSHATCQLQPCLNNGSCFNSPSGTGFTCVCLYPFTGDTCQVAEPGVSSTVNTIGADTTSTFSSHLETFTSTELSPTSTQLSPTSTELSPTSTELSPTSNELSPTSTELSPTSTELSSTSTELSSTSTELSSTSTELSSTSTELSSTSTELSSTSTELSPISNTTTSVREVPPSATKSTKGSGRSDRNRSTTPAMSVANVDMVSQMEKVSHFEPWYIAVVVAAILIAVVVVLIIIIKRRRRRSKHSVCPPRVPAVSFNGTDLSFENAVYSNLNGNSSESERQTRELPAVPLAAPSPAEEDLFNPTKPALYVQADDIAAAGSHVPNQIEQKKQTMASNTSTLHGRPVSERTEGNPYTDFQSLTDGQGTPQTVGSQEGSHYDDPHEVAGSMPRASAADEYSDLVFNLDPLSAPVVRVPPSPYDIPSNNSSYYSTPSSRASMLPPKPDNGHSTTPLRGSEEIEFQNAVLVAEFPAQTQAGADDSDSDSSGGVGGVQEDLAKLRQDVRHNMSPADV